MATKYSSRPMLPQDQHKDASAAIDVRRRMVVPAIATRSIKPAALFSSLSSPTEEAVPASPPSSQTSNEAKAKPRRKSAATATETFTPPDDWLDIWSLVRELRSNQTAPCNHSGFDALPHDATVTTASFRFQVLLNIMLSSQSKEVEVGAAVRERQRDEVATLAALAKKRSAALIPYLNKCSFYNNKTRYILETVWILQESYGGDIPKTAAEMMKLPGVGPRMAYICESVAWGTQSGIGVDRHMYRVFKKLGFVPHHCKSPEQARVQLQSWLPHEHWGEAYGLWVGFSQAVQQEKDKLLRKALLFTRPRDALLLLQRCGLFHPSFRAHFDSADMARVDAILQNGTDDENEK